MTNTKRRSVRVDDETWQRARSRADELGETVADVVRRTLEQYGRPTPRPRPSGPNPLAGQLTIIDPPEPGVPLTMWDLPVRWDPPDGGL